MSWVLSGSTNPTTLYRLDIKSMSHIAAPSKVTNIPTPEAMRSLICKTCGHTSSLPDSCKVSYASASSAPLANAIAKPLITRLTKNTMNTEVRLPVGTKVIVAISMNMIAEDNTTSFLRPNVSVNAPDGTSASTIVAAKQH